MHLTRRKCSVDTVIHIFYPGVRGVSVIRHRLGGVDSSLTRRARQEVASNERLRDLETKARWDAVDLPWGRRGGIHALPVKNLRFLHIQWSIFSWTPPDHDILDGIDPDHWPGYQLAMLIKNNTYTLDHVFIDEYPGFCLEQDHASLQGDALLEVLARNAPSLRTLSLGGLLQPYHIHRRHAASETALLSRNRASYPQELLHFAFGPSVSPKGAKFYLIGASVDDALKELVSVPVEPMGRSKVQLVTMDLSEAVLAEVLPLTFWTGPHCSGCWASYPTYPRLLVVAAMPASLLLKTRVMAFHSRAETFVLAIDIPLAYDTNSTALSRALVMNIAYIL
ncbi:hypothetical protein FB446DRAFT_812590 [Lentinula raphanica]|nr:hypothetical protein FB446DRAFT_812590 [Lentinula raphanica]